MHREVTLAEVLNRLEDAGLIVWNDDRDGRPTIVQWLDQNNIDPATPIPTWNEQAQAWEI